MFARLLVGLHASSLDHHRGDGRGFPACAVWHEIRAAAVLSVVGPRRTWSSTGTCLRTPRLPKPMRRWLNSSANSCREMPNVDHWSTYVGTGAPRFVLSFDLQTANTWFGQMVVVTKGGIAARDRLKAQFETYLKRTFPGTDTYVKLLEVGPPVGRPVQYRLSGPDIAKVRELAQRLAGIVRANPHLDNVVFDWMEPARVVKVDVLQDKARQLGVSSEDIATALNSVLDGTSITQVRDSIYLVNVVGRATAPERASIDTLRDLQLIGLGGQSVPLGAVATLRYELEQPTIWRRSRLPTITLKASPLDTVQPKTVVDQLAPQVEEFAKGLPAGYSVAVGGAVEESAKSQAPIEAVVPLMLFIMATILMIQLQSFHRLVPGVRGRAACLDRRGVGFAAERSASRIRCDSRCTGADRHSDPQLGDIDCADRTPERGRPAGMGGGRRSNRASHAANHADRCCRESGAYSDCARDFLGTDGLCDDGRHHRWYAADAVVPASALCGVVSGQSAGIARRC